MNAEGSYKEGSDDERYRREESRREESRREYGRVVVGTVEKRFYKESREFGAIRGNTKRKYNHGEAACWYCQDGDHHRCRPRLDNSLCTCSCKVGTASRARVAAMREDDSELSIVDCVRLIAPKQRKVSIGGDIFRPVDRSKDNPLEDC